MLAITPRTRYMTYSNSLKVTNISYRSHTFRAILWENLLLSSGGKCLTRYCLDNSFTDLPQHVILISQFLSLPWCALTGSNRRHLACKASTLPAELSAHNVSLITSLVAVSCCLPKLVPLTFPTSRSRRPEWRLRWESNPLTRALQARSRPTRVQALARGAGIEPASCGPQPHVLVRQTNRAGAAAWVRTRDAGLFRPALYQLSYRGKLPTPRFQQVISALFAASVLWAWTQASLWYLLRDLNPKPYD